MTEYYRLIAVLGAQLNLDSERAGEGKPEGATEGLTLKRLAVWVVDPMERLKQMATLVSAAAKLKVKGEGVEGCYRLRSAKVSFDSCVARLMYHD